MTRRTLLAAGGAVVAAAALPSWPAMSAGRNRSLVTVGANCSGLEINEGRVPGVPNVDYAVPTTDEFDYYRSRNLTTIRLPIQWTRLQPTLYQPLDPAYLDIITGLVDHAGSTGMGIILDLHNYGGRGPNKIGNGNLTSGHFADLWERLATAVVGKPGLAAYDLMNEPSNMPSASAWPTAAQAAVDAIRGVDTATTIVVEGDNWSSAASWVRVNADLDISDPGDNLVYSAHVYFDRDSSGSHYDWPTEVAAGDQLQDPPGPLTTDIGVQRISGFVQWCQDRGFTAHIGEVGTGNNHPDWLTTLDTLLAYCVQNEVGVTYWSAGRWFETYPYGIEPTPDGRDTVQMAVLEKYTGAAGPTDYSLSGPDRGTAGSASESFSVDYRGYHTAPITVTPTDFGAGGAFQPTSVVLPAGFNGLGTFTYTPPGTATYRIGTTNSAGLTDPPALGLSTRTDGYSGIDSSAILNAIALRRLYTPFVSDALTLRRDSDGAQRTFAFTSNDRLDQIAIGNWAPGTRIRVVTAADQAPAKRHAGKVVSDNHNNTDGSRKLSSIADYPTLIFNGLNGMPVMRFHNSRMEAVSPIDGLTGFTCFMVAKATSAAAMKRLLSWHFTELLLLTGDSGSTWQMTGESSLPLGVDPTTWHIYAVRWQGGGSRTTWVDGRQVATAAAATSSITFQHDNHVNVGYFRWYHDVYFDGDVWALLPFRAALDDAQMTAMWAALSGATGIAV